VFLGTIDDWAPEGSVVSWHPTPSTYVNAGNAASDDVPVCYQQSQHLRFYREQTAQGRDIPRLCIGVWDIPGVCDVDAMTHAINTHVRRHDTYHSWFAFNDDSDIVRYTVDNPEVIEFRPVDNGAMTPQQIRKLLLETPDPLRWDCFSFGVIQRGDSFTVYVAIDHLLADGMSAGVIFVDVHLTYLTRLQGTTVELPDPGSYREYCAGQRAHTASLTSDSPQVRAWHSFVADNGGALPSFPLPLGETTADTAGAIDVIDLIDDEQGKRFEAVCRDAGARFSGGVFACAALAEHELTGADTYFGLTPFDNRTTPAHAMSVGWFASFVPLTIPTANMSFADAARAAQRSFTAGRGLGEVPFYYLLERESPQSGPITVHERPVPMLSYIDIRRIPFSDQMDGLKVGIWGDNRLSDGVCMWINRMHDGTQLVVSYPDNPIARESITRYAEAMKSVFERVADGGHQDCSVGQGLLAVKTSADG
jgi:hypothetical protein